MSYLCQKYMYQTLRVTDFTSEIKHLENYPDFEEVGLLHK